MDRSRRLSIGDAIEPFYGAAAGNRLTALLKEHITGAVALLQAAKSGRPRGDLDGKHRVVCERPPQIADFLQSANPHDWSTAEMRSMMKTHLDQRYSRRPRTTSRVVTKQTCATTTRSTATSSRWPTSSARGSCASSRSGSDRRCGRVAVSLPPTRRRPWRWDPPTPVRGRLDHWQRRHARSRSPWRLCASSSTTAPRVSRR